MYRFLSFYVAVNTSDLVGLTHRKGLYVRVRREKSRRTASTQEPKPVAWNIGGRPCYGERLLLLLYVLCTYCTSYLECTYPLRSRVTYNIRTTSGSDFEEAHFMKSEHFCCILELPYFTWNQHSKKTGTDMHIHSQSHIFRICISTIIIGNIVILHKLHEATVFFQSNMWCYSCLMEDKNPWSSCNKFRMEEEVIAESFAQLESVILLLNSFLVKTKLNK